MRKHGDLKVLSLLRDPALRDPSLSNMPSFAVDWSFRPPIRQCNSLSMRLFLQNETFSACKGAEADWYPERPGHVRANGFIFDWIETVCESHVLDFGITLAQRLRKFRAIVAIARERCGKGQEQTLQATIRRTLCMDCKRQKRGVYSRLRGADDERLLSAWWERTYYPNAPGLAYGTNSESDPMAITVWVASVDRTFVFTKAGRMGLAPSWCKPRDAISVMGGGALPMVLRPVVEVASPEDKHPLFEVVVEAYVHGFMDGQAFDAEGSAEGTFDDIYLV
jgi:hypothetical protein